MINRGIIALFITGSLSTQASALALDLAPPFGDAKRIELTYSDFPSGDRALSATLIAQPPVGPTQIANVCEPEGGDPEIGNVATVAGNATHGDILAIICIYKMNHSGIGLVGTQFEAKVFEKKGKTTQALSSVEEPLSGFEGQSEDEEASFYFYKKPELFKAKLKLVAEGQQSDSLELAHGVALELLRSESAETAGKYLSAERIDSLIQKTPLTGKNAALYNDIGYVLVEANKMEQALSTLLPIEKAAPQRIPLYLNIADAYWPSEKDKARAYYAKYQILMIGKNKKSLIPERVKERTN